MITMLAIRYWRAWPNLKWVLMVGSFGLLALSIVFSGSVFGAKNWFTIAGITVQPSEFVKVLLVVALAGVLHPVSYTHLDVYKRQGQLEALMKEGREKAARVANRTMSKVYRKMGFIGLR